MKVIIAGTRTFNNYPLLSTYCDFILQNKFEITIVSGTAKGADKLGEQYAKSKGYPITQFKPDWDTFGKAAGYRRNSEMAQHSDALIAFWDGKSKGTKHMIDIARKEGLKVRVYLYEQKKDYNLPLKTPV